MDPFAMEIRIMAKPSRLMIYRDLVRLFFVFSFFFLPDITEKLFGVDVELENEYVVLGAIALLGTFWCGWFCPFGNVQYFAGIIGKMCFPRLQLAVPGRYDRPLRWLKYGFLVMFLYVFATQEHGYFDSHMAMYKSTWYAHAYLLLKKPYAIMLIPLFIPRFFCKYLCYQKAGYQIINACFPLLRIRRRRESCITCSKCTGACPMDIDIARADRISGGECVGCLRCVDDSGCPTDPSSLRLTWFGREVTPLKWTVVMTGVYVAATLLAVVGFRSIH